MMVSVPGKAALKWYLYLVYAYFHQQLTTVLLRAVIGNNYYESIVQSFYNAMFGIDTN